MFGVCQIYSKIPLSSLGILSNSFKSLSNSLSHKFIKGRILFPFSNSICLFEFPSNPFDSLSISLSHKWEKPFYFFLGPQPLLSSPFPWPNSPSFPLSPAGIFSRVVQLTFLPSWLASAISPASIPLGPCTQAPTGPSTPLGLGTLAGLQSQVLPPLELAIRTKNGNG